MIWGQFWASRLLLRFLQGPPFSNLHRCRGFWRVGLTMLVYGFVSVKATRFWISGGKEYMRPGLPGLSSWFLVSRMKL